MLYVRLGRKLRDTSTEITVDATCFHSLSYSAILYENCNIENSAIQNIKLSVAIIDDDFNANSGEKICYNSSRVIVT